METKTKVSFTPGPWHWRGQTIVGGETTSQDGIKGTVVCLFGEMWKGDEERTANARLIAASPDLLKAAEAVCEDVYWSFDSKQEIPAMSFTKVRGDKIENLRAAIAKATA